MRLDDGRLRPDLVVTLAGGRTIAVDAKAPLAAFLDLTGTDDPAEHDGALARLGEHVRKHVADLGSRRYWEALAGTPEFVVLFLPGEAILQAALQAVPDLVEQAAAKNVVLATPSTLIALLRTVAQGWQHEVLNAQAHEVQRLGQELHARLGSMAGHLDRVGRSLGASVAAYNQAMGSLEGRVLVSARRFAELGVTSEPLEASRQVEAVPRSPAAPELTALDGVPTALGDPTLDDLLAEQARPVPPGAPRGGCLRSRPRLSLVNQAEAFWEVGREPGRQVVSLGVAVTLTAVSIDVLLVGRLTLFFDLCFMVLCLGLAALVRRRDFYLVALLPPVLMACVFAFVALVARDAIADPRRQRPAGRRLRGRHPRRRPLHRLRPVPGLARWRLHREGEADIATELSRELGQPAA